MKSNTEPAGALAKQRLSLLPTERVGCRRNTSGRGAKETGAQKTKHKAYVSQGVERMTCGCIQSAKIKRTV